MNQNSTQNKPNAQGVRRPRLSDVANLAGVSLGSASKALSMPDKVRPATLEKVQQAALELGYVPHGAARALARRCSMLIGLVLPTINNPIYADFSQAIQKTLRQSGYQLLIAAHEYDFAAEQTIVEQLLQTGIDGLLLVGSDHPPALFRRLQEAGLPYLCTWSTDESHQQPCVGLNNRRAMHQIIAHLAELGHEHITVIAGTSRHNERTRQRILGIEDEMTRRGLPWSNDRIIYCDFTINAGREGMRQVLAMTPRPSAVVCTTDLLAAGALAEAKAQGIQVPQQLTITGFDDIALAELMEPSLTTLHVATDLIGHRSAEQIIAILQNGKDTQELIREPIEIPTRLVVRQSSGPVND